MTNLSISDSTNDSGNRENLSHFSDRNISANEHIISQHNQRNIDLIPENNIDIRKPYSIPKSTIMLLENKELRIFILQGMSFLMFLLSQLFNL